jgi:hypothetical protein
MMAVETTERSFSVPRAARLALSHIRGTVDVRPGADSVIHVIARKRLHTGDAQKTQIEMTQASDGSVTVVTRFPSLLFLFWPQPCHVDYVIRVPRSSLVRLEGVSNTASIRGLQGEFELHTVSGPLALEDLSGPLRVNSVSGEVRGERLAGPLQLETVSGAVHLAASQFVTVRATAVSGRLWLETPLNEGPYHFDSISGDVRLTLPAPSGLSMELHTASGRVECALPLRRRNRGQLDLAGGGPRLCLHSVSGSLRLEIAQPHETVTASAPSAATDRHAILEGVARGELSLEAALAALKTRA